MFGRKTRDLIVETATIVKRVDRSLIDHNKDNETKFKGIHDLIKECHGSCPESSHIRDQNGTLNRMEEKYDVFYKEHKDELGEVKKKVQTMATEKKTRKEVLKDWLIYISIVSLILGTFYGYARYQKSHEKQSANKIEQMLEEILKKG